MGEHKILESSSHFLWSFSFFPHFQFDYDGWFRQSKGFFFQSLEKLSPILDRHWPWGVPTLGPRSHGLAARVIVDEAFGLGDQLAVVAGVGRVPFFNSTFLGIVYTEFNTELFESHQHVVKERTVQF